jgi:catechol 2,3-dioxygenase-like lactoylglutathione lyase family enzyme
LKIKVNKAGIFNRLDTIIVRVKNLEESKNWYIDNLSFFPVFSDDESKITVFDLAGTTTLTLWQFDENDTSNKVNQGNTYAVFNCDNAEQIFKSLKKKGVAVDNFTTSEDVSLFNFYDPDGNKFEVIEINQKDGEE